jgi:hypothetical protein
MRTIIVKAELEQSTAKKTNLRLLIAHNRPKLAHTTVNHELAFHITTTYLDPESALPPMAQVACRRSSWPLQPYWTGAATTSTFMD